MKNDYEWNLGHWNDPEYIAHGTAHYSAHWNKADQDRYNKEYYQKHKDKWGVKGGYNETSDEVTYSGKIGDEDDYDSFLKKHGDIHPDKTDRALGKGGDYALAEGKDGHRAIYTGKKVVASGDDIRDLDDDDLKVIDDYLTEIYAQAGDHLKKKGIKEGSNEEKAFMDEFDKKVEAQVKGIIAKEKQAKAKRYSK